DPGGSVRAVERGELLGGSLPLLLQDGDALPDLLVSPDGRGHVVAAGSVELGVGQALLQLAELGGLAVELALHAAHRRAVPAPDRPLPRRRLPPRLRRVLAGRGLPPLHPAGRTLPRPVLLALLPEQVQLVVAVVRAHPA